MAPTWRLLFADIPEILRFLSNITVIFTPKYSQHTPQSMLMRGQHVENCMSSNPQIMRCAVIVQNTIFHCNRLHFNENWQYCNIHWEKKSPVDPMTQISLSDYASMSISNTMMLILAWGMKLSITTNHNDLHIVRILQIPVPLKSILGNINIYFHFLPFFTFTWSRSLKTFLTVDNDSHS